EAQRDPPDGDAGATVGDPGRDRLRTRHRRPARRGPGHRTPPQPRPLDADHHAPHPTAGRRTTRPRPRAPERADRAIRRPRARPRTRSRRIRSAPDRGAGVTAAIAELPTERNELWRYTPVDEVNARMERSVAAPSCLSAPVPRSLIDALTGITGPRLVFVNGFYAADLSDLDVLPVGLRCGVSDANPGDAADVAVVT